MLNAKELREYRLLRGLSLRDVSMYCNLGFHYIAEVETGAKNLTEKNHQEIVKGINAAAQAIADGTFEEDKRKFNEKENEYERGRRAEKAVRDKAAAAAQKKKGTKPTTSKQAKEGTK